VVKDCGYMEIRCINCIYIHIQPKYDVFNLDFKDNVFLLMQNITFDCGVDTQRWDVFVNLVYITAYPFIY